jgi:hypothetical protein
LFVTSFAERIEGQREIRGATGTTASNGSGTTAMAHILQKAHFFDRRMLARLNTAIVFGPVLSGLAACMLGAIVYDVGRWFSVW